MQVTSESGVPQRAKQQGLNRVSGSEIQKLVQEALCGDERAIDRLYRCLLEPLDRFFRKSLSANSGAELAHQTLVEALGAVAAGRYDPGRASFLAFVYGVAVKIRLREIRSRSRDRLTLAGDVGDAVAASGAFQADPAAEFAVEQIEAMRDCLIRDGRAGLSAEERFVVLGRAERKTYEVMAKQLGRSLDTVHRCGVRGLEKLRKCMASKGFR